jgi:hypothetical protein
MKVCNHASRNRKFMRRENEFICPTIKGFSVPCEETELSTARIDVAYSTNTFLAFASFTISQAA